MTTEFYWTSLWTSRVLLYVAMNEKNRSGHKGNGNTASSILWSLDATWTILPCAQKTLLCPWEAWKLLNSQKSLVVRDWHWPLFGEKCRKLKPFSSVKSYFLVKAPIFQRVIKHNSHIKRKHLPKITSLIPEEATRVFTRNLRNWVLTDRHPRC